MSNGTTIILCIKYFLGAGGVHGVSGNFEGLRVSSLGSQSCFINELIFYVYG